jgi:hypothetical protein
MKTQGFVTVLIDLHSRISVLALEDGLSSWSGCLLSSFARPWLSREEFSGD